MLQQYISCQGSSVLVEKAIAEITK